MSCASLHLFIGAILVLAVGNEATTMINSTESTPLVYEPNNTTTTSNETILDNSTVTSSPTSPTVVLSNTTEANDTSDEGSDLPTTSSTSEEPQTNGTTDNPPNKVPQASTNKMIQTTTSITTSITTCTTTTTKAPEPKKHGPTYIIILVIAVLFLTGVVVYCCLQKNSRKYSVDLHPKKEDAQIPLSTVDAEVFDTTSEKDLQTFAPVEPVKDPDIGKEAEKPEEGKEMPDVKQENQQNLSTPEATVIPNDKKEELTVVDLTDAEPAISTKTSMESLDDTLNENNSNNTRTEANNNGIEFTEIFLDGLL
ncbi:mucin-2 isoform X2 [Danio aesculapii]|uniref:mucin-2 isoform X2 n=1 Tax=Danio aesculapii TaxID=1142201 RepID=UPI0024BF2BBD|nr:mucin-2 isoform X2 [Danio aesculapii]